MNQEITEKYFILILRGGYKIWLSETQFEMICNLIETQQKFIRIDKWLINKDEIAFIGLRADIEKDERIKRGEWQCEYCKRWHSKFMECGCQGGKY